jgi:glycosyltransferase involved in cell wall biosynthesis
VVREFKCVTYCSEPTAGLSRARNTGLRRATCEIVAWTDDDAIVHPSWIHAILEVFSDSTISGMTGLVIPVELETTSQIRFERDFGEFNRGYRQLNYDFQFFSEMQERGVPVWKIGAGANMAFRRNVFDLVGLFDERLGAGAAGCSEDSENHVRRGYTREQIDRLVGLRPERTATFINALTVLSHDIGYSNLSPASGSFCGFCSRRLR